MNLGTVWIDGKEMRKGYTTGSCAAAAAKAAVTMLFGEQDVDQIQISTPAGIQLDLNIYNICRSKEEVSCSVQKDGGDDPDVTHGLHIFATARKRKGLKAIVIEGGEGVGRVTLPGLPVAVGQPAINPIPRQMILQEVQQVLPKGEGVEIVFSIPGGAEIAQKTLNPRLGIEEGLSILGTTGIVEPMSEEAWKESLRLELKISAAKGCRRIILVPGNYGWDFACSYLGLEGKPMVKMSNFAGYMLKQAESMNFKDILIVGDLGKLIKVSAGIFHTHSDVADARMEIMAAYAGALGAAQDVVAKILEMNTTSSAIELLESEWEERRMKELYQMIAARVSFRTSLYIHNSCRVGTVLFSRGKGLLALDESAKQMLEEWRDE